MLNAIKFSENCVVEIHTSYQEQARVLQIDVVDAGVGIPQSEKSLVFNKFSRCPHNIEMNPNGIGLGLHICKQIMSHLGGDIHFESKDHSTTFSVNFPISTNAEVLRKQEQHSAILLKDDSTSKSDSVVSKSGMRVSPENKLFSSKQKSDMVKIS